MHARRDEWETALDYYQQASSIQEQIGDLFGQAAALGNIGQVYDRQGEWDTALDHYQQALTIRRQLGDRAGEAVARFNIAMMYRAQSRLQEAVAELEEVIALDTAIGHPDLAADTDALERVRAESVDLTKVSGVGEGEIGG